LSAWVSIADFILSAWLANRVINATWRDYVPILAPIVTCALIAGLAGSGLQHIIPAEKNWLRLLIGVGGLVAVYTPLIWLVDGDVRRQVDKILDQYVRPQPVRRPLLFVRTRMLRMQGSLTRMAIDGRKLAARRRVSRVMSDK
jgi:hypothetical protein